VNIANSNIRSSLFLQNNFIELKISSSPLQTNYLFENKFFKVKNVNANNFLATFYKNEYEKSSGFEKDLIHHEEKKCFIKQGEKVDNMKNYMKQISVLVDKKPKK
jgi:hypothetical protein